VSSAWQNAAPSSDRRPEGARLRLARVKATLLYTVARIGIFVVIALVLVALHVNLYLAVIAAALLAFLISYLALGSLRRQVAENIVKRRSAPERDEDADLEDAVLDGSAPQQPARRQAPAEDD
jgi:hypothetical protein